MKQIPDRANQQLGNYRLMHRLGRGGFAEVYLGEHIHLKTHVAVKVLLTHLDQEAVETFRHEAQTIARLRHPYIVQVLDFGIENETPYLVMDYAPHGTLRQHHPKGTRLPSATVVSYVKQVAEALQYAHEQRFIHRDVKPENLLLGRQHEALLSDFGIALTSQNSSYQSTQNIAGTVVYMAPEQIKGHPRPASDQYSLGIIVYEWLCGNRPFQGSFTEVALQHTITPPPPLRKYLPTVAPEIEQVVMIALQKEPQQRFPSVRAFAQALEQACQRQDYSIATNTSQAASTFTRPPSVSVAAPPQSFPFPMQQTHIETPRDPGIFPGVAMPSHSYITSFPPVAAYPPLPAPGTLGPEQPQPRRFSRRVAAIGIVGLVAAASSGLTWAIFSQRSANSTPGVSNGNIDQIRWHHTNSSDRCPCHLPGAYG